MGSSPLSAMVILDLVEPERDPRASTARITSSPSSTSPNTTCFPSSHGVLTWHAPEIRRCRKEEEEEEEEEEEGGKKGDSSGAREQRDIPTERSGQRTVQMKNWEPLVSLPALAIDSTPGPVCLSLKFSSLNLFP